uniref:GED domain-containing protein n=1 Tax=Toxocara canis TaxID=6265 RepID=A0A183V913_TOXCA
LAPSIDDEVLRAVLDAQEERQQRTLKAVLKALLELLEWNRPLFLITSTASPALADFRNSRTIQITDARSTYGSTDTKMSYPKTAQCLMRPRGPASFLGVRQYSAVVQRHHSRTDEVLSTEDLWAPDPEDADMPTRALRKVEDNPQTTLKKLILEIEQFLNIDKMRNC